MNIFDFITQDEIDELPEDSAAAFMTFVRHAQRRLADRTQELNGSHEDEWRLVEEARYGFQNVTIAAAKRFGIEPFASMSMPLLEKYNKKNDDYRQFIANLDHYMTQLVLDSGVRGKRESVLLALAVKDKIRSYLHGLRTVIDQAEFTDSKRAVLLEKLAEFERELEKRRLNLLAVTRFVIEILAIPGALWASYEVTAKLTSNILQAVGEAKAADDENRQLPPFEKPFALLPPRKKDEDFAAGDPDEEIPF